jgi:hypothetical protein
MVLSGHGTESRSMAKRKTFPEFVFWTDNMLTQIQAILSHQKA